MIIVSQDKRTIVNFDNLKTIELDRETNFTAINIFRETNEVETGVCGLYIGKYATEERAREVLREIVDTFGIREIRNATYQYADLAIKSRKYSIYEMPES